MQSIIHQTTSSGVRRSTRLFGPNSNTLLNDSTDKVRCGTYHCCTPTTVAHLLPCHTWYCDTPTLWHTWYCDTPCDTPSLCTRMLLWHLHCDTPVQWHTWYCDTPSLWHTFTVTHLHSFTVTHLHSFTVTLLHCDTACYCHDTHATGDKLIEFFFVYRVQGSARRCSPFHEV